MTGRGTPSTISPEIHNFDDDIKHDHSLCDMYSLGIVMYYYLNGRTYPFGNDHDKRLNTKGALPEPRYGSKRLKQLVVKATQYYPKDRFESPQKMLRELQQCEEYKQFVSHETNSYNKTIDPTEEIQKENERLRKQLEQREQKRQAEVEAIKKAAEKREREFQAQIEQKRQAEIVALEQAAAQRERELKAQIELKQQAEVESIKRAAVERERELQAQIEKLLRDNETSKQKETQVSQHESKSEDVDSQTFSRIHVGDRIKFGQYPQGKNGEVQPLIWRVLAVKNGKALIITDKLLDYMRYKNNSNKATWKNCSLRNWLNRVFMSNAFSIYQQAKIATVLNQNSSNPDYKTSGGDDTQDRIFALSIDEAKNYFSSDKDRVAYTTDYARGKENDIKYDSEYWWLRSPGHSNCEAVSVGIDGKILYYGLGISNGKVAIRPALWLNLLSYDTPDTRKVSETQQKSTMKEVISHASDVEIGNSDVIIGNIIEFGKYSQGENGEVQPLLWRVLTVEKDKALIITEMLIDYLPYNEMLTSSTWETCTVRNVLNGDFISKAFTNAQQIHIIPVINQNSDNPKYKKKGGNNTKDRVFALSIDEATKYFLSNANRRTYTTDYAYKKRKDTKDRAEQWWLRSPGSININASFVNFNGEIVYSGNCMFSTLIAVRPALWLNLKNNYQFNKV